MAKRTQAWTLETCQPRGPDGEGQAKGQARYADGEPSRPAAPTRTGTPEPYPGDHRVHASGIL
jgi:hypothetical protein